MKLTRLQQWGLGGTGVLCLGAMALLWFSAPIAPAIKVAPAPPSPAVSSRETTMTAAPAISAAAANLQALKVNPCGGVVCSCGGMPVPGLLSDWGPHLYINWQKDFISLLPAKDIANQLTSREAEPLEEVQAVKQLLEEYRRAFGAMPVGEQNDEIVRRLQGHNPKGLAVLPPNFPGLNSSNELTDRWGTPYRFHPESAWNTEVRSAGPDREMWTQDDILTQEDFLATLSE